MSCKFKYGDRVKVGQHTGKIISITKDHIHHMCRVKFDNRFLIPQEMVYTESELELLGSPEENQNETKCTCGTEKVYGKVAKERHSDYCDLLKPKSKIKRDFTNKTKPPGSYTQEEQDLLDQFEIMLDSNKDDDDDDFGWYYPN